LSPLFKRNPFFHVNKFQKNLIYPVVVPCFLGCMILLFFLDYLYFDSNAVIFDDEFVALKIIVVVCVVTIALIFLFISFCIYFVSNRLVGPYDRIIRELDDIIAGRNKSPLKTRKKDKLFPELLKRINILVERMN